MPVVINGTTGISGVDGSAGTPSYQGGDTNTGIFYPAADTIAFAEGGTEVMRIDSSGNVGIGTSSPTVKLEVAGAARLTNGNLSVAPSTTTQVAVTICTNSGGSFFAGLDSSTGGTFGVGSYSSVLYNGANTPMVFFTNGTERMRVASGGSVSIGTTSVYNSPTGTLLSVNGGVEARGHVRSYYSSTTGIANGASLTLMSLPAGSFGGPIAGILNVVQRNDNTGNLTMSTYLVSGFGGSGADFTAVTTRVYGSGSSFTIAGTAASGNLVIAITNTSGATSTSINFSFLSLQSNAITYGF